MSGICDYQTLVPVVAIPGRDKMRESASILNLRANTNMWITIEPDKSKRFDKPWLYANTILATGAGIVMMVQLIGHIGMVNSLPSAFGFYGVGLISIVIHAVYTGSLRMRGSVISQEDDPGQFWAAFMVFMIMGLFIVFLAWGPSTDRPAAQSASSADGGSQSD